MLSFKQRLASLLVITTLLLSACGGDGQPTTGSTATGLDSPGRVAVLMTDDPSDRFDEINLTVTSVDLLGESGRQNLFSGEQTFNLLALRNFSDLFSITDVPPGRYEKIRLTLSDLELLSFNDDGSVAERVHPRLPGNGKLDLKPDKAIVVEAGETLVLELDVDAEKSLHIVETGRGDIRFRPVVFVNVVDAARPGRFLRLTGEIDGIDSTAGSFRLCIEKGAWWLDERCLRVQTDADTSFFNAQAETASLSDLADEQLVTAVGHLDPASGELTLDALLVAIGAPGNFASLRGEAGGPPLDDTDAISATGRFDFMLDSGQGFTDDTQIEVQLLDGAPILSRSGLVLSAFDVEAGTRANASGLLLLSDVEPDTLRTLLLVLDTDPDSSRISGTIGSVDGSLESLVLQTALGDRCVELTPDTRLFRITHTDTTGSSEAIAANDLAATQQVDVHGLPGVSGCFVADLVFVFVAGTTTGP